MPDFARIDARFGTRLAAQPPRVIVAKRGWKWLWRAWPERARSRRLPLGLAVRELCRIERRWRPTLWVSTCNEMWMPQPGLQYVHYPDRIRKVAPGENWSLRRRIPYLISLWISDRFFKAQVTPPEGHRSLVNSAWTRERLMRTEGISARVVHPPVPPFASGCPWEKRDDRVVCLGRWNWLKRLEVAVDVVEQARRAGAVGLRLAFAGSWDATDAERAAVMRRCEGLDWIEWHERPERDALQELIGRSRYGLHAAVDEHFGIAVAEMMTAGCVVLVHDSGGPAEIVQDPRQRYSSAEDGGRALRDIWSSRALQTELHEAARARGLSFSTEAFCAAMREEINACALQRSGESGAR